MNMPVLKVDCLNCMVTPLQWQQSPVMLVVLALEQPG